MTCEMDKRLLLSSFKERNSTTEHNPGRNNVSPEQHLAKQFTVAVHKCLEDRVAHFYMIWEFTGFVASWKKEVSEMLREFFFLGEFYGLLEGWREEGCNIITS